MDMYDKCISVIEGEISTIESRNVTDAQLEEMGSYCVPHTFADLVKGIVFPQPPFPKYSNIKKRRI